jgi:hypothetical protein
MQNNKNNNGQLFVKSNVARDLLQNAAIFKNSKMVVWEYVSNGLDYIDSGTIPVVNVTLDNRNKKIVIIDNGRGMKLKDLENFFIMHGENIDRKKGRPGRGRFGTGKSAAFGIADTLRVTTVRNKKLSKVELRRKDIEKMETNDQIPVTILEKENKTDKPNGTMIEIEDIHLKSLDQQNVIQYIERHLANWPNSTVFVNNHVCEFKMPPAVDIFEFMPDEIIKKKIGECKLIIKVSGTPLDKELCGVSILSNNVLHEITLCGNENRPMAQYVFGEIDVPFLDSYKGPITPFDLTRSMRLNPSNELVQAIYAFVGQKIDFVRRELEKKEKEKKSTEEAKKLANEADRIAKLINEDFNEFKDRVSKAKSKGKFGFDTDKKEFNNGMDKENYDFGKENEAEIIENSGGLGATGSNRSGGKDPRKLNPKVKPGSETNDKLGKYSGGLGQKKSTSGGFKVEFKNMGIDAYRATYINSDRTIYINLEHPQLFAAKKSSPVETPLFKRLAYEVAFCEYAVALAAELNANEEYTDTSDPIVDIRETINRIARKAAPLYENQDN